MDLPVPTPLLALRDEIASARQAAEAPIRALAARRSELSTARETIDGEIASARDRQAARDRADVDDPSAETKDRAVIEAAQLRLRRVCAQLDALPETAAEDPQAVAALSSAQSQFRSAWGPYRTSLIDAVRARLADGLKRDLLGALRLAYAVGAALKHDFALAQLAVPAGDPGSTPLIAGEIVNVGGSRENLVSSWKGHKDLSLLHEALAELSAVDRSASGAARRASRVALAMTPSGQHTRSKPEFGSAVVMVDRPVASALLAEATPRAESRQSDLHGSLVLARGDAGRRHPEAGSAFMGSRGIQGAPDAADGRS
jgi:hypothetical protein